MSWDHRRFHPVELTSPLVRPERRPVLDHSPKRSKRAARSRSSHGAAVGWRLTRSIEERTPQGARPRAPTSIPSQAPLVELLDDMDAVLCPPPLAQEDELFLVEVSR